MGTISSENITSLKELTLNRLAKIIFNVIAIYAVIFVLYSAVVFPNNVVVYQKTMEETVDFINANLTHDIDLGNFNWFQSHLSQYSNRPNITSIYFESADPTINSFSYGDKNERSLHLQYPVYNAPSGRYYGELHIEYLPLLFVNQLLQHNNPFFHLLGLIAVGISYICIRIYNSVNYQRVLHPIIERLPYRSASLHQRAVAENLVKEFVESQDQRNDKLSATIERIRDLHYSTFDYISFATVILDEDGRITRCNQAFRNQFAPTGDEVEGRYFYQFIAPNCRAEITAVLEQIGPDQKTQQIASQLICDGEHDPLGSIVTFNYDEIGHERIIVIENRSELNLLRNRLERTLAFDNSTGLLRKEGLVENIDGLIRILDNNRMALGVAVFKLTALTRIRDLYGLDAVEKVLRSIAEVIYRRVSPQTLVGLFSENEIVLVGHAIRSNIKSELIRLLTPLKQHLCEPLYIKRTPIHISHTVGAAIWPESGSSAEELLQRASLSAKSWNIDQDILEICYDSNKGASDDRLNIKAVLMNAMEEGRIIFDLQPIFRMSTREISMYELLVRLVTHDGVRIPPNEFLEVAEQMNMMGSFVQSMVNTAYDLFNREQNSDKKFILTMNLSISQILLPDLFDILLPLKQYKDRVVFEIVNSTEIYHREVINALEKLVEEGFTIASDDCDASVRSLIKLSQLPVKIIKLDKTFFSLIEDDASEELVSEFISRAQKMKKQIVMEGVESKEELDLAQKFQLEYAQGYFLGLPQTSIEKAISNATDISTQYSKPQEADLLNTTSKAS